MVTSTLPIFYHLAFTLFDSGATYSFSSEGVVKSANLELEPLEFPLTVSTPANTYMTATRRVRGGSVIVAGRKIVASLIVLCMQDFDVLLGMDWLDENCALIDCEARKITFRPLIGENFEFKGDISRSTPRVITTLKARKLLYQGAWAILASVTKVSESSLMVSSVPVVGEFEDVFPEELPGLPPNREVDFVIDLEPGTTPISKAPYRMAPAELKKLKVQLQELMDKGFIRPSVSPWGAPVLFVKKKD